MSAVVWRIWSGFSFAICRCAALRRSPAIYTRWRTGCKACGIRSAAMESTSVYWIPLHQILEARGIQAYLVNAQHVKNVPGRKTDVSDCQWIQYLHSVGLLRASFRPPAVICAIRSLWRHRDSLIQMAAEHVMHIQKALDQMNLQVHRVLSDITGLSGFRIMDAILTGERDPVALAQLCHSRVKSSREIVAKSLEGDYRNGACLRTSAVLGGLPLLPDTHHRS